MAEHIRWGGKAYSVDDNGELQMLPPYGQTPEGYAAKRSDQIAGALSMLRFTGYLTLRQYEAHRRNVPGFIARDTNRQFSGVPHELNELAAEQTAALLGIDIHDVDIVPLRREFERILGLLKDQWITITLEHVYGEVGSDPEGEMTDRAYAELQYERALEGRDFFSARGYELGCRALMRRYMAFINPTSADPLNEDGIQDLRAEAASHGILGENFEQLMGVAAGGVVTDLIQQGILHKR